MVRLAKYAMLSSMMPIMSIKKTGVIKAISISVTPPCLFSFAGLREIPMAAD